MSPGEKQQQLKDELRERFIAGPSPARLRALLSAANRERDELAAKLRRERDRSRSLEKELDETHAKLARARRALAENDPATYWQRCQAL